MRITRELNKKSPIYCYLIYTMDIQFMLTINNPILMSMCYLCFYHVLYICALISFFQFFLLESRPMISHHVTYHVTAVICLFIIKIKQRKEILNQEKQIKEKKNISIQVHHNTLSISNTRQKTISIDFVVKLLESVGFNTVMAMADLVSKIVYFVLIYTIVSIEKVVRLFLIFIFIFILFQTQNLIIV